MEEKMLKLVAQLGLIALIIWIVASAFGHRDDVRANTPAPAPQPAMWVKGDVWQRSCVAVPYAEGTYAPDLQMGR